MNQKVSLANDLEDFGRTGKNWLQPLRAWILDANKAEKLSASDSFPEIKAFVQKVGTNPLLLDKSVSVSFGEPWDFAASRLAGRAPAERRSREAISLPKRESSIWWTRADSNRLPLQCKCSVLPAELRALVGMDFAYQFCLTPKTLPLCHSSSSKCFRILSFLFLTPHLH